ncbi:MAG TPA: arsenate reductase ArsC [Candidatus Eisenbacteria bacterium]|nr:arsenate reductase ArsC [Candidatus Eisenbacteria bacterium]
MPRDKPHVLFLDGSNAAGSLIAEALLHRHAGERFEVASAGLEPREVTALTRQVLEEVGIEATRLRSKRIKEFLARVPVHYAIILTQAAKASAPRLYPFAGKTLRWPCADPLESDDATGDRLEAFRQLRDQIDAHIRSWVAEVEAAGA